MESSSLETGMEAGLGTSRLGSGSIVLLLNTNKDRVKYPTNGGEIR